LSLRQKIVLLFLGLAVVPLLAVATFGFLYSAYLNREATTARLEEAVAELSAHLEGSTAQVRQALKRVPTFPYAGREAPLEERGGPTAWQPGAALSKAVFVRVVDRNGSSVTLTGSLPAEQTRCGPSGGERAVPVRAFLDRAGNRIAEAYFWLDDLIGPSPSVSGLHTQIVDRNTGVVLFSTTCQDVQADPSEAALAAIAMLDENPGLMSSFGFRDASGDRRVGSLSVTPDGRWLTVAEVGLGSIIAPFGRLGAWYWVFVILLAASTSLAFSALLGRVTNSLKELIRAAKRIGAGDLLPWLPPPGDDEVGELTVAFREMSDQIKRMVDQVDQNSRLAVVGELSAYLAHEIRNPLSCVKMNLQRIERWGRLKPLPAEIRESGDISLKAVDGVVCSLTSSLQLAGRDETQEQVRNLKGAFLNLMMNGLEVQPHGGRLHIRSALENVAGIGPAVAVHIRDQGPGVPNEIRERIFEPFFTTKFNGSGIGLAVVSRTLRAAGGDVYLADLPVWERGAEFVVRMPLAAVSDTLTTTVPQEEGPKGRTSSTTSSTVAPLSGEGRTRSTGPARAPVATSTSMPGAGRVAGEAWHTDHGRLR
jgi:signal transduction histidine kinase